MTLAKPDVLLNSLWNLQKKKRTENLAYSWVKFHRERIGINKFCYILTYSIDNFQSYSQ